MTTTPANSQSLRQRKKEAQRREIYQIALDKFRDRGFENVTVQEIASEANISTKTFFNYYPSKQAILDECVRQLLVSMTKVIRSVQDKNIPFRARLDSLVGEMADALENDPKFWLMIFRDSKLFNASGPIKDDELEIYELTAQLFREAQSRGEVVTGADALQLAEVFFSIYYFTTLNWLSGWWPKQEKLSVRLNGALSIFFDGVLVGSEI